MTSVRVKICGLTRAEDVRTAVEAGADAVGFVFAAASPRRIDPTRAVELALRVPPFVTTVGLFLDQEAEYLHNVLEQVPLGALQFHGSETAEFCRQFGRPWIKAVSALGAAGIEAAEAAFPDAAGILLDSHLPGGPGGTGRAFDWSAWRRGRLPLVVAGGLNAGNVRAAIAALQPWAVDVSSGVESAPGIKDSAAVREFIQEVKREC